MKVKKIIVLVILILLSNIVHADLSDYPDLFNKNEVLNVTLVVGDGSSASNVLAQAAVLTSLSSIGGQIKSKLASEVEDLNRNIISFGNPCINEISRKIMYNPNPCDKRFVNGQAYIEFYKYNDFVHIVVAGYSDIGTRKAAEYLADYEKNPVSGNTIIINVPEEKPAVAVNAPEKIDEEINESANKEVDIEKEKMIEELNKKIQNNGITKEADLEIEAETEVQIEEESDNTEQPLQPEEKPNIIRRFINWLFSIFK